MLRVVLLLLLFAATSAWGQVAAPDVTVAQLDAAVARVTVNFPEDNAQRIGLLKSYADTRSALVKYEHFSQRQSSYAQARSNAVREAQSIEHELAMAHLVPLADDSTLLGVDLPELEQMILVAKSELDADKNDLADTRAEIDAMPGRPAEIRTRVTALAGLASDLDDQLDTMDDKAASGGAEEAAVWLTKAQLASVEAEKEALEEELLSQPMRLQLLKAQLDQLSYNITLLEKQSQLMIERASVLRQGEAAQAQATADMVVADTQGKHESVRRLADKNAVLTQTFSQRNGEIEAAGIRDSEVRGTAEQLELDLSSIEHKLELLGMSTVVGEILRERQAQLPGHTELAKQISDNSDDIRASSLRQVELEDERRLLRNPDDYFQQLIEGLDPLVVVTINDDLVELVRTRRDLVRQAIELENIYAQTLGDLDFSLRKYIAAVDAYRDFISERLLWIPSRDKFGLLRGESADLFKQVKDLVDPSRWISVIKHMPTEILKQPVTGVLLMVVMTLIYYGGRLKKQLADTGRNVGYVRSDKFSSTAHALGLSVLLSIKWPLLMLTAGWLFELRDEESELASALYLSLVRTSLYFWGLEFLRFALLPKGLVDLHFRWPTTRVAMLRRRIVTLEFTLLPAVLIVVLCLSLYPRTIGGILGTLGVVLALFAIAHFFHRLPEFVQSKMQMIIRDKISTDNPFWPKLLRRLLYWIPIAAILAVFLGYTFTAIEISLLLIRTFVLLSCILILYELGLRFLGLTRRRMAYSVRQGQVKNSSEDVEATIEDEILENDPELLNDEGTKLLNLLTLFGGVLGIAWIWSEVFPALSILDTFGLWHQTTVVDGLEIVDSVTLADVFSAIFLVVIGLLALQRVPGLFEIFLRQKLKVAPASAYAFTRVSQYAFTLLLIVFVVSTLGISWSSLQWAVAALSLGIGFGLQEIVANFISGLIILFEQPIRLGDTITVGDTTGTVTRIQMRATTIRDFDQHELLVPNKEFITSRLLNWTLSDSVTRRIVKVGAAYGSDMDKAIDIVRDIARKHPLVLATPAPVITLDDFGNNSLLICLRFYIDDLDNLLTIDSEIRLQINRSFNEAGIEIAFPQRDIHLDTNQPLEIKMVEPKTGD